MLFQTCIALLFSRTKKKIFWKILMFFLSFFFFLYMQWKSSGSDVVFTTWTCNSKQPKHYQDISWVGRLTYTDFIWSNKFQWRLHGNSLHWRTKKSLLGELNSVGQFYTQHHGFTTVGLWFSQCGRWKVWLTRGGVCVPQSSREQSRGRLIALFVFVNVAC